MQLSKYVEIKTTIWIFWIAFLISSILVRLFNLENTLLEGWSFISYYAAKIVIYIFVTRNIIRRRRWARSTFNALLFIEIIDTGVSPTAILLTTNGVYTMAALMLFDAVYAWVAFNLTFGRGAAWFHAPRREPWV